MTKKQWIQNDANQDKVRDAITNLTQLSHGLAVEAGWWANPHTGERIERNDGELIALMHSELSEALEAIRKNLDDDHLPQHKGVTVELADTLVRIFDYCGARQLPIGEALAQKLAYNAQRADHKASARQGENGKQF